VAAAVAGLGALLVAWQLGSGLSSVFQELNRIWRRSLAGMSVVVDSLV
jgi:hypothetical protein